MFKKAKRGKWSSHVTCAMNYDQKGALKPE
jgi:hypothetical protein